MSLCPICLLDLPGDKGMCDYHEVQAEESVNNRAVCDFVHRGVEPSRLAPSDREPMIFDMPY